MLDKSRLAAFANLIKDRISADGIEQYCAETGVEEKDFISLTPSHFNGCIFAIDGSNMMICDWSVGNLNRIRAGYVVYRGTEWLRTVITYDDLFLADPKDYRDQFDASSKTFFDLGRFYLADTELDRLTTYFRELQEYIALLDAINEADPGDLVLYDGGFALWKDRPLGAVCKQVLSAAEKKNVDLLAVSKSSAFSFGGSISKPFIPHTRIAGSQLAPEIPWHLCLSGKRIEPNPDRWDVKTYISRLDGRAERAFRIDAPSYLVERIASVLGRLAGHSCSAECLGYPHALYRAHRDIKITEHEGEMLRLELLNFLSQSGLREYQIRDVMLDYHEIIEMRLGKIL